MEFEIQPFEADPRGILMFRSEAVSMRDDMEEEFINAELVQELTVSLTVLDESETIIFIEPRHIPAVAHYYMRWANFLEINGASNTAEEHRKYGAVLLSIVN